MVLFHGRPSDESLTTNCYGRPRLVGGWRAEGRLREGEESSNAGWARQTIFRRSDIIRRGGEYFPHLRSKGGPDMVGHYGGHV